MVSGIEAAGLRMMEEAAEASNQLPLMSELAMALV